MGILSAYFKSMHTYIVYLVYKRIRALKSALVIYRIMRIKELYAVNISVTVRKVFNYQTDKAHTMHSLAHM